MIITGPTKHKPCDSHDKNTKLVQKIQKYTVNMVRPGHLLYTYLVINQNNLEHFGTMCIYSQRTNFGFLSHVDYNYCYSIHLEQTLK